MAEHDCYACKVGETHPATTLRSPGCQSCDSRLLAAQFGGLPHDVVTSVLVKAWPETKAFRTGRSLFWMWTGRIEAAKAKT